MAASPIEIEINESPPQREPYTRRIGRILIDLGKLKQTDVEHVLHVQDQQPMPFGVVAVKLGMLTSIDVESALALQYEYPYILPGQDSSISRKIVTAYNPFGRQAELFRSLKSALIRGFRDSSHKHRCLAIVSPGRAEGRSYVAANLALVMSQSGLRTLLLDADLRNPRQHELFGLNTQSGLSTLLLGRGNADATQTLAAFKHLSVLPAGPLPPNPQELLQRSVFHDFLRYATEHFDMVIIDTSAAMESADAASVAADAGVALMVARKNHTRLRDAKRLATLLTSSASELVGTVLNQV